MQDFNKICKTVFIISLSSTFTNLTLYVPCILNNSINKQQDAFFVHIYFTIFVKLHISKDYFIHHQEFLNVQPFQP